MGVLGVYCRISNKRDNYSLGEVWEKRLAPHSKRMVVIDDSGKSKHFCDVLIDTEITRTDAEHLNLVPKYCQVLVGSKYVMLRNDIIELRKKLNLKEFCSSSI